VRLITNPGSNLTPELIARYKILVLPQHIVVDGVVHDTRTSPTHGTVEQWVRDAKRWPETVGTTAAESIAGFQQAVREGDTELVVVTTSKKIINSHASAERAKRTLLDSPQGEGARIAIIDTGVTDVGALLACMLAGEAIKARLSFAEVVSVVEAAVRELQVAFALEELTFAVKGGRASFLRAWVADILGVSPILAFTDGALNAVGRYKRRGDVAAAVLAQLQVRVPAGRRVWAAVGHSSDTGRAMLLRGELERVYDVAGCVLRPIAAGVYLKSGPGTLGAAIMPIDALPWKPPALQ
jgi:DegV family protein with EDD domain